MTLLIISHTEHYMGHDGIVRGWGPTVMELDRLAPHFERIYHLAYLMPGTAPASSRAYGSANIEFVALPPSGGRSLLSKLGILLKLPKVLRVLRKYLKASDAFQLRTPFGMGVFLIPYLTFLSKQQGWYKYAGNWNQAHPPLGYRIQRWWLKRQDQIVTINGKWPGQAPNFLSFENPCLTDEDCEGGRERLQDREFTKPFKLLFVGRLEDEKGVQRILDVLSDDSLYSGFSELHLVGDGARRPEYEACAGQLNIPVQFHGFLPREAVFKLYKNCDFLLLPSSASEGFPKVLAEAMNFGCIPVVTGISSIGQYISGLNGILLSDPSPEHLKASLLDIGNLPGEVLLKKAREAHKTAQLFTYKRYNHRVLTEILNQRT